MPRKYPIDPGESGQRSKTVFLQYGPMVLYDLMIGGQDCTVQLYVKAYKTYDSEIPTPRTNRLMLERSLGSILARHQVNGVKYSSHQFTCVVYLVFHGISIFCNLHDAYFARSLGILLDLTCQSIREM